MEKSSLIVTPQAKVKDTYRVTNWSSYNKALINRGNFTFWLNEDALSGWYEVSGRGKIYGEGAILALLQIGALFRLPLRQTQGFMESLVKLLNLPLKTPNYSTLSRRRSALVLPALPKIAAGEQVHIAIDSTGLKVYGEGEWKVRTHKASYRRTWRKLHIAVDTTSGQILSAVLTDNDTHDSQALEPVLAGIVGDFAKASLDKAYDGTECHEQIAKRGAMALIPPRDNAKTHAEGAKNHQGREDIVQKIRETDAAQWKKTSGYHRRSIAETTMYRFKKTFGGAIRAKNFNNQINEVNIKIQMLNAFLKEGKPAAYKVNPAT